MAQNLDMDLVEINATSMPPVAKIMDYGKHKYDQKKKAAEARKNQKTNELREVWIKPFIDDNDLNIKMRKVTEWLAGGEKVKITAMTKGSRRVLAIGARTGATQNMFEKVLQILDGKGALESKSKPDERTKSIIIAPVK